MKALEGQVAVVTGGSKGIGLAIGRLLAQEGASVLLAARNQAALEATVNALRAEGLSVDGIATDVSVEKQVQRLIGTAVERYGKVDILVNNAGFGVFKHVLDLSLDEFDTMWNTNMRGSFLPTKAVLPHMTRAKSGSIVFISSLAGKNSFKGGAGYCATKWAMRGFASSLMLEVREQNIRVVTIFPGSVDTSFSSTGKKGGHITQPEDVAHAVLFAVTAPERSMFSEIDVRPTNPAKN
jgi:NADP-dependent 3-hydroxy acid dehydrogenase YdfG